MRTPEQADRILERLKALLLRYPDLRLGQLLANMSDDSLFFSTDQELLKLMEGYERRNELPEADGERYVIVNFDAPWDKLRGKPLLFWRANKAGYTNNLNDAGLYEKEEALSIHRQDGRRGYRNDVAVPESVAWKGAQTIVLGDFDHDVVQYLAGKAKP